MEIELLSPVGWLSLASPAGLGPSGAESPFDQGPSSERGAAWNGLSIPRDAHLGLFDAYGL